MARPLALSPASGPPAPPELQGLLCTSARLLGPFLLSSAPAYLALSFWTWRPRLEHLLVLILSSVECMCPSDSGTSTRGQLLQLQGAGPEPLGSLVGPS